MDTIEITKIVSLSIADGDFGKKPTPKPADKILGVGEWERKADMPTARDSLTTSVVNGKVYAIGGSNNEKPIPTVEEYDPATDNWARKADMPTPRSAVSTSVVNGKIYAIGGFGVDEAGQLIILRVVEEYDPLTNTWAPKADMPTARECPTAVVDGKIYAFGGENLDGRLAMVEVYDPATNSWDKRNNMPRPTHTHATAVVNGKIYVMGGFQNPISWRNVEEYDPATDTWTKKADMLSPRALHSTAVVNGKIYAIGGAPRALVCTSSVEVYDPVTDIWAEVADMVDIRCNYSAAAVDGVIYAIGGFIGEFQIGMPPTSTVEAYDTGFRATSVNPTGKLAATWGKIKTMP